MRVGRKMNQLKTLCICAGILVSIGLGSVVQASDVDSNLEKIKALQPDLNMVDFTKNLKETAAESHISEVTLTEQMLGELQKQCELDEAEQGNHSGMLRGGSSGSYLLGVAEQKGDIFYTPSSTLGIQHGHTGVYYDTHTIVESIPETGVRKIGYNNRNVEKEAVMQRVNVSQEERNAAAEWANSRVGKDGYSYNFLNNRNTSDYGDKNCSKLVWSAYKISSNIDMDVDKGLGVYPRDIRDSEYTETYQTIE